VRIEEGLRAAIEREGYVATGPAVLAVYENPWTTVPFMRRNELHLHIEAPLSTRLSTTDR